MKNQISIVDFNNLINFNSGKIPSKRMGMTRVESYNGNGQLVTLKIFAQDQEVLRTPPYTQLREGCVLKR